ncbi:MAG: hypothetical protein ABSA57_12370 [Candidatus Acidiferrales bacterium]|jgi:glucose-6-phosphate isomerase
MTAIAQRTTLSIWKSLEAQSAKIRDWHLRELFADDATRGQRMALEAAGIY